MIDIEKLAVEYKLLHGKREDEVYNYIYQEALVYLKQFAEAYHKAMCEQSEPVGTAKIMQMGLKEAQRQLSAYEKLTTPPRQQPLKRLSALDISLMASNDNTADWDSLTYKMIWRDGYIAGANAMMDEMERINK